jgi:DNA invertase Pin-like site-specific DNA recombinase
MTATPAKRLIGYARVSTFGQTLDSQLEQLRKAGCASRKIYREKVTGARPGRRELNKMLGKLRPGDVVTATRIDRLARSTFDLFGIVKRIVDAKAQFRSLAEPWADTGTSTGRLMLAVLGGLADVERDLIRTRTAEGRSRAELRGKHMGRPPSFKRRNSRKRPPDGAQRALRCRNWRTATTAAYPPCAAPRAPHEPNQPAVDNDREISRISHSPRRCRSHCQAPCKRSSPSRPDSRSYR